MLYYFLTWLNERYDLPGFGVFNFITFRAAMSVIFSLIIAMLFGKRVIDLLRKKLIGESIRTDGPQTHKKKAGTPTMGGVIILLAILVPTLLWADIRNAYVALIVISTIWIGLIGFADDYIKVFKKDKKGLQGKFKIIGQVGLGLIVGITMVFHPDFKGEKGHVNQKMELRRTNDLLFRTGFANGDHLIRINGKPLMGAPEASAYAGIESYTVERNNNGKPEIVTLTISPQDRFQVAQSMFGQRDERFVTQTNVPFLKNYSFDYANLAFWDREPGNIWGKLIYVLIVVFIITAVSNGVNLTDGLDGLAAGTSAIVAVALAIFCYVSGNIIFSKYLNIYYIPQSAELVIYCAALVGACIGFLWYNSHPAQVFMGDTGSLALGGAIGVLALMIKKELLLPTLCGIFLVESLSVIIQVTRFKYHKKKFGEEYAKAHKWFRMTPLHHHYELGGMHEAKIVTRFWILGIMLAVLAFATLKLR